jgi:hypothetical protein
MIARFLVLLAVLLAGVARGQSEPSAEAPDFSEGFKRLSELGLPPLDANAKWSTLPSDFSGDDYQLRQLFRSLKGNGWHQAGAATVIPAGGVEAVSLDPPAASGDNPPPPKGRKPRIPEADLDKDIHALIKTIRKIKPDEYSYRPGNTPFGTILLLATQLHQSGHGVLANQLAAALFEAFPMREAVLDSAIDSIASHAYQKATAAYFQSGDAAAYHQSLTQISGKFPRGWSSREAVAIFLPQLAKQAAGEKAAEPSLPGTPLDPRALEAIAALDQAAASNTTNPGGGIIASGRFEGVDLSSLPPDVRAELLSMGHGGSRFDFSTLWLIDPPAESPTPDPLTRIASLGMPALPVLAALVNDPFLTRFPNPQSSYGSSYYSSNEGESERILRIHASLNRPASRGEIARSLLTATLPDPDEELNQSDPDTLAETALTFWKDHRESTREKIAIAFLSEGSTSQARTAATLLAKSEDPLAHQALEAHILAADPAIGQFQNVQTYLAARKSAAQPFFDRYAALVRAQTPEKTSGTDDEDEDDADAYSGDYETAWRIRQAGGPIKILKQLESLVAGKSPRAIAREIAKGNAKDAEGAIEGLASLLEEASPLKTLYAFLEGAVAADDTEIRSMFLMAASEIDWDVEVDEDEEDEEAAEDETAANEDAERSIPEAEIKVWRKLVADTRPLPAKYARRMQEGTISDLAIATFMANLGSNAYHAIYEAAPILQKKYQDILREQALARLEGKPIPPLPDASRVTPDRLKSIIQEAAAKEAAGIHPYLKSLTPDERAAWLTWLAEPGEIEIPASILALGHQVVGETEQESFNTTFPDAVKTNLIADGWTVNAENLRQLLQTMAADPAKHSRTLAWLAPTNFGPGLESFSAVLPFPKPPAENGEDEEDEDPYGSSYTALDLFRADIVSMDEHPTASAIANLNIRSFSGERFEGLWTVENGQLKPSSSELDAKLGETLAKLKESDGLPRFQINLRFLTKEDAEKLAAAASEGEAEDE